MRTRRQWGSRRREAGTRLLRYHRGGVTLELILNLPVWIIFLLAVIQFGQLLSNAQQVALASRIGAEEASETATTTITTAVTVPTNIVEAIEHQLESAGVVDSGGASQCRVILEHNLNGTNERLDSSGATCSCDPPTEPPLPNTVHDARYVRVTVCVPYSLVAPNLLGAGGLDFSSKLVQHTTTFRHEG